LAWYRKQRRIAHHHLHFFVRFDLFSSFLFGSLEIKCFFQDLLDVDLVVTFFQYRTLHGVCLSCACGAIDDQITISALQEFFTHALPIAVLKHILLGALLSKYRFKYILPFTIVEVVVGIEFNCGRFVCLALTIFAGWPIALDVYY